VIEETSQSTKSGKFVANTHIERVRHQKLRKMSSMSTLLGGDRDLSFMCGHAGTPRAIGLTDRRARLGSCRLATPDGAHGTGARRARLAAP